MKTAVSAYSFAQYTRSGKLTMKEVVAKAKELGFDAIEFLDLDPPDGMGELAYASQLREECEKQGIPVSNYTIGADFSREDVRAEAERVMRKVDVAAVLGAAGLRHDAAYKRPAAPRGFSYALPHLADGIRRVTDYAAEKGVRTMVENHGFFVQDADRVEALVNAVDHPNFGWLCDMGNFLCADEDPAVSCGKAAPYAFYVHAKDFIVKSGNGISPGGAFFRTRAGNYLRGTVLGHGNVPVLQCLQALKDGGYDGYVSIEFEGMEDCIEALSLGVENLKRYLSLLQ